MKKQKDDKQSVADLLKKLQESYLGGSSKASAKKKQENDDEDEKFRRQLAAMLGKAESASKPKKKAKKQVSPAEAPSEELPTPTPIEKPNETIEDKPKKQRSKKPKKERQPENIISPSEEVIEEPVDHLPAEEAPVVEEVSEIEETLVIEDVSSSVADEADETIEDSLPIEAHTEDVTVARSLEELVEPQEIAADTPEAETEVSDAVEDIPQEEFQPVEDPPKNRDSMIFLSLRKSNPPLTKENTEEKKEVLPQKEETPEPIDEADLPPAVEQKPKPKNDTQKERIIRIAPPARVSEASQAPSKEPEASNNEPIRIQPKVTLPPPSQAPDFAKEKPGESTPIVIRPTSSNTQQASEAIVIHPRTQDKPSPAPQIRQEPISTEPIKIGKETKSQESPKSSATSLDTTPHMIQEKEKNTSAATDAETLPNAANKKSNIALKKTMSKRAPGVSLPKSSPSRDFSIIPKNKRQKTVNRIPLTTLPDDDLEEVLDDAFEELPADDIPFEIPAEAPSTGTRNAKKRTSPTEENLSATELIRRKSGLSEDDIAMIFELGYENELERLVGHDALKQMKNEHLKHSEHGNQRNYRTAFGYRGEELVNTQQATNARAAYLHDRKFLIARLCLTVILTVVALFADMPSLVGNYLTDLTAAIPFALPLAGMLTLWAAAALSWRQINAGIRSFFKFSPTPYSVPALLLPFATVYDVILLFVESDMIRVNFLISLAFLVLAVCDVFRLTTEMRALQILTSEGEKSVLAPAAPRKKKLRHGDKIVKIINDDLGQNMYHVKKTVQISGFFRRFNSMHSAARPFTIMIGCMFALATLSALVNAVCTSSFLSALSSFMTVLLLSAPLEACLMYFYPIARANRLLARRGCALLGEESVEEYREPKTVIFRDSELYTAEQCTEIAVREEDDFKNDLRLAGILFRKLGGTLKHVGESARTSIAKDPPVAVVRVHDDGVEAVVDNRDHMAAGNAEFLKRVGIRVPRESTDKILRRTPNTSLMYVAINGVLKLSYEIEYTTNATFEALVCDLAEVGVTTAIHSYDPNLNESFLQKSRSDLAIPVYAVKPGRYEEDKPLETVDSGSVALGDPNDVIYPLYAAKGIDNLRRFGIRIQLISALLATLSSALLSIFGQHQILSMLPILGYQLIWLAVSVIASISELNPEKLRFFKNK